jgi:type II secretory ATPase GspE/PulE/Tfp pilus assembly ATPase PilB-like protein
VRIGELLIQKGIVIEEQVQIALEEQKITGELLGDILINLGFVSSSEITRVIAEQEGLGFIDLKSYAIPEEALRIISRDIALQADFIPLNYEEDGVMSIGVTNSTNIRAVDVVTRIIGKSPKIFLVDKESFHVALEESYYFLEHPLLAKMEGIIAEARALHEPQPTTIVSLTELILMDGIRRYATDIHIRPMVNTVHVFYRIDGVMHLLYCLPKIIQNGVISRIKIISQLNIAETRLPQDGSFAFQFLNNKYDMRVSMVPTIYGENVVVRILRSSSSVLSLGALGFKERVTKQLRGLFSKPYGIILITGPTGSGKTTTLYSALREIDLIGKNVITVEDPVEYRLSMVRQTQVNQKAGYDFALAGRSFMRQDPDVMLLGEIRDEETASIAVRASITGHLVLSTLHTNDAVTSIPRLSDLGVDRFLMASSLRAVIAQRLLRKVCPYCRETRECATGEMDKLGLHDLEGKIKSTVRGRGCKSCNNTGFLGRMVIGEVFEVNDEIRELIYQGASTNSLKQAALTGGMVDVNTDGLQRAIEGITTFEEVLRVTG